MFLIDDLIKYVKEHETAEIIRTNLIRFFGVDETYDLKQLQNLYESAEYNELDKPLSYFEECIEDIRTNCGQYKLVYENYLVDNKSKDVFTKMLYAKVFMDVDFIESAYFDDCIYFSESIWGKLRPEAYIDCGGYIGDTTLQYIIKRPDYSSIYVYEPLKEAYDRCCSELSFYVQEGHVKIFPYAICKEEMNVTFSEGNKNGDSKISSEGTTSIPGIALDHTISEPVGFIKMDIEGSEKEALLGAKKIIQKYQPQMAICIYHLKDDFWKIPQTILEICPEYCFKIRQHAPQAYAETVLYCIPKENMPIKQTKDICESDFKKLFYRLDHAIKKMVICSNDEYRNVTAPLHGKAWWFGQIRKKALSHEILESWCSELQQGNRYLTEKSKENLLTINEQKEWIAKLEESKAWLELKREEDLATIKANEEAYWEQQSWISELEQGKTWLEDRRKEDLAAIEERDKTIKALQEYIRKM